MTVSPDDAPDPRVGSVIQGRYKILAPIASGGMGVVYRGERLELGRSVAIKFLHPWIATQQSFLDRFRVEAQAMSRLGHPNCVSVIDFGVEDVPFLVMDFVAGRNLRSIVQHGRLEPARALALARQILSGVAHAHAQGIVHRDLKPENVIIGDTVGLVDHVRILDFGLAKLKDGPALTVGMAVGTPSYMAPEQTLSGGVVDSRTDIYAVGILLFEMLTGTKPFASDSLAELILMQQEKRAPRMSRVVDGVTFSDALEAVIAKAVAKKPAERFASAAEMAAALDAIPEAGRTRSPPPEVSAAAEPTHATAEATICDPTILSMSETVVAPSAAVPGARSVAKPAGPPLWKRLRDRGTRFLARPWRRRQWIVASSSAAAVLLIVLVWALSGGDSNPVAPSTTTAASSTAVILDELAPMGPDPTPGLADAAHLLRSGQREAAIASLKEIRRLYPRSPYANFLLAVAHFEKLWWSIGLQYAQTAMQLEPAYRRSPKLTKLLIYSLMSDSFWEKASYALTHDMAEVSGAYLEHAAQYEESPRVRARAAQILGRGAARGAW